MVRKSNIDDIAEVVRIYDQILEQESEQRMTGWQKNIYPLPQTALNALNSKELFVMEVADEIVAAAIINQKQVDVYSDCEWEFPAENNEIMVLHTLVVDPEKSGKGYATEFVKFYENYALDNGCQYLRMDTNEINIAARRLYQKLGYKETGTVPCEFNGIQGVQLVCLEKRLYRGLSQ